MPANPNIYFDIETGPLPLAELNIPAFNPADVKFGNIKNPDLIAEKLQKAEESHTADYIRNAALDALSGQVLCFGYRVDHLEQNILCADADGEAPVAAMVGAAQLLRAPAAAHRLQHQGLRPTIPGQTLLAPQDHAALLATERPVLVGAGGRP